MKKLLIAFKFISITALNVREMKYDFDAIEYSRLVRFFDKKLKDCLHDPAYFDSALPTWYDTVEKLLEKMKVSHTPRISLSAKQVRHLSRMRDLDTEFPEFDSFLVEEKERLIDAGKLPMWLRTGA